MKHSVLRYKEICVEIIAWTAFHVKCLFITLDGCINFDVFETNQTISFYWMHQSSNGFFALDFNWSYLSNGYFIFYINIIIHITRSKIHKFLIPKPFLQLKCAMLLYWHIKSIYANWMIEIKYSRYQIDNIHGSLYLFLVDKSVDVNNHCFLNNNVNSYSIKIKAKLGSLDLY